MTRNIKTESPFVTQNGQLVCESVPLAEIAAQFGTPTYVYSRQAIVHRYRQWAHAPIGRTPLICYAVKANANLAVLNVLAQEGCGFDIVSGGELARVQAAGGDTQKVVFSGVGKTIPEIEQALAAGILCFNVESAYELDMIERVAQAHGTQAPVSIRVNPDVDARTHPYISTGLRDNKFGVAYEDAHGLYRRANASASLRVEGIDCHIGSQITSIAPYVDAADRVLDLVDSLKRDGIHIHHIDFGGGLGIRYREETPPASTELICALFGRVAARGYADKTMIFEPGRALVGEAGALLTRVTLTKQSTAKRFAVVDAAMNDLMRPALYEAWMDICPVLPRAHTAITQDIVGPVCESADWLGRARALAIEPGDLLAIKDCGAYGMSMASNYNSRPRAAEVMVDNGLVHLVRKRETIAELYAGESLLP